MTSISDLEFALPCEGGSSFGPCPHPVTSVVTLHSLDQCDGDGLDVHHDHVLLLCDRCIAWVTREVNRIAASIEEMVRQAIKDVEMGILATQTCTRCGIAWRAEGKCPNCGINCRTCGRSVSKAADLLSVRPLAVAL